MKEPKDHGNPTGYVLIENQSQLLQSAEILKKQAVIGVDLEADSMYHYKEKVCLLQFSTPSRNIIVDPLSVNDLSPLIPIFADRSIHKIFHGADYDIRSLYRDFKIEVNSLFDTQIAARFLGCRETGLANLLRERFDLVVEKKYQKRDWSRRPLPEAMLRYGAQDASGLIPLARLLQKDLRAKGRLAWVEEECEILSRVRPKPKKRTPLFLGFKGASRLDSRTLAVLEAVLRLRESLAKRRDVPPFKVFGNTQILGIVQKKPMSEKEILEAGLLSERQVKAFGRSLPQKISDAMSLPEDRLPKYPKKTSKPNPPQVARRVKSLKVWREQHAQRMDVESAVICSNAQIQALAISHPKTPDELGMVEGLRRWQQETFGSEICSLLERKG